MGWRLAEEIAWARPERPGPEWWTLLDIAQDARDETRQSMCGHEYLMARGKCSKRTLYRRLEALRESKLITVVRKPAPGLRAIYEIEVIHRLPETGATNAGTRTGATNAGTRSDANGCHSEGQRVPEMAPTGASVSGTHAVTSTPSLHPVIDIGPVVGGAVEGSRLSTGQERDFSLNGNPAARHARKDAR